MMQGFKLGAALLAAAGLVTCTSLATTIFEADFNASTETGPTVTNNASVSNLNAGTAVGTWSLTGPGGQDPGAIVDNVPGGAGTDNAFVFDSGLSGGFGNQVLGLFSQTVDLADNEILKLDFDIYASRAGANKEVRLALKNANGTNAYVLIFDHSGNNRFRWINTSNGATTITSEGPVNGGFTNASDGSYLSWSSGTTIGVSIEIAGPTLSDTGSGPATTGGKVSIDWDNDGVIEAADNDVANIDIGPRVGGINSIDRFSLFYGGSGTGAKGAYFDNFVATVVPEPGTLLLLVFGGLALRRRC